ncbi:hypothetical protein BGX34_009741 [Mortierella sp. NVP85]|nr:hypothetical protein BGX34_009741 [Mortierella sp. NVP85]
MYILRTVDTLHHNPFTGDKITKARVFSFDSSSLPGGSTSPQHTNLKSGQTLETEAVNTRQLKDGIDDSNQEKESLQSLPKFVAIKYLNNHKVVRKRAREDSHSDDSHDDSDDDIAASTDDDDNDLKRARSKLEEWQRRRWPLMAETKLPSGIEFGVSAKREIRALKAVQGHPNVIPFLGFTTLPKSNPFKTPKKRHDGFLADPLPLGADLSQQRKDNNNESLLGLPLGRSLFQDQGRHLESSGDNNTPLISSALGPLLSSAPVSGFDSDGDSNKMAPYDSDFDSSDSDGEGDDVNLDPSTMSAQQWEWVFSRQPWVGGIIFPYLPLRLLDLIEIGWTAKRPLMVEMSMRQILEGLAWLHNEAGLIHRDLSPTNIMVTMGRPIKGPGAEGENEDQGIIQCMISDFGCATFYRPAVTSEELEASGEHPPLKTLTSHGETREEQDQDVSDESRSIGSSLEQKLTFEVGTRAYRAPELLFSSNDYTNAIDIWSTGVIFAEMYLGKSLFTADTDITQICAIVKILGVITEQNWPEYSSMPDAGKLLFNVRDRTPLSQILLSGNDSNPSTSTAKSGGGEGLGSNNTDEGNSTVAPTPPTLISQSAFELIESMIAYSGAARPSAKEALEFKNSYLMRTKELEVRCGTLDATALSRQNQDQDQDQDQDQEARRFLQECVIHEQELLVQVREELALLQEARKRASNNSDSEGDYQDQYYWTDSDDGDGNGS